MIAIYWQFGRWRIGEVKGSDGEEEVIKQEQS